MASVQNKAYEYCKSAVKKKTTPKYVKKQMRDFIRICEGKNKKYCLSEKKLQQIENILKLLIMPKGLKAGMTLFDCTCGYQWLFYTATLCIVHRDNPDHRRYETGVLEICRKNFKTYTIAAIFIILFLTEPQFSEFFSVAPDGALSREIRTAIYNTIKASPSVYKYKGKSRWKLLRDYIQFKGNSNKYTPLAFSTSTMDGKLPSAFCADEVGALPIAYPIEAMQSGQINILNKLGFIISTKYPTIDNPMEAEVKYSKDVLDGLVKDETRFSLLFEPDETTGWETNDLILKQANPVALEIPEIWQDLLKKRRRAVAVPSKRENFVTKHCNIVYQGVGTETYIDVKDVQACRSAHIDWTGRVVYLGLDLSQTNDNTSCAMVAADENNDVIAQVVAFVPEDRLEEKKAAEGVDYIELCKTPCCIACGDRVIDYAAVEAYVAAIEKKYGVQVQAVGYDRWNALATAQHLEQKGFNMVEVRQHSSVLHPPTKLLQELIESRRFSYEKNPLLEINFQNARVTEDTNKNKYVNKKRSKGKVDMVISLIIALYLLQQDVIFDQMNFVAQVG